MGNISWRIMERKLSRKCIPKLQGNCTDLIKKQKFTGTLEQFKNKATRPDNANI
jgi:hypothetical protein